MENNLKEALEYAVELREGQEIIYDEVGEKIFYDSSKASLRELDPIKYAETLTTKSLSGLVGYLKSKFDEEYEALGPFLIHVEGPTTVKVYSRLDENRKRENVIAAAASLKQFPYGEFIDSEQFIINVLSLIQRDETSEIIRQCASQIHIEGGGDLKDDGVSQTVTMKEGATLKKDKVPSPAELRPYRTFLEVEQPKSPFIFRVDKYGRCALFEADGGLWRHEAMDNIKGFLNKELKTEIDSDYVTIIA